MQLEILENCDVFLPNAKSERTEIAAHLGFRTDNMWSSPTAVDVASIKAAKEVDSTGYERFSGWIVCIGRIDIRKNQLNLIKAVEGSELQGRLCGKEVSRAYRVCEQGCVGDRSQSEHGMDRANSQRRHLQAVPRVPCERVA